MAASLRCVSASCNNKWYYSRQEIDNNPSRRAGLDPDKELSYRQQAANLLQDMGQRLNVSQLTINTAIVYMHRFYMVQSFTRFHRNVISPAALFLAAKVEEQPRKLEHVIKVAHACLNPQEPSPDVRSDAYLQQAQDLVILESIILQTLAFEITIDHPHTHVVKCTQLVRASKDLAQTSYFMATNSLHLTTFCLQYSPPVVACVCIHLACKWSNWEIPVSTDGKHWWEYVDPTVTLKLLDGGRSDAKGQAEGPGGGRAAGRHVEHDLHGLVGEHRGGPDEPLGAALRLGGGRGEGDAGQRAHLERKRPGGPRAAIGPRGARPRQGVVERVPRQERRRAGGAEEEVGEHGGQRQAGLCQRCPGSHWSAAEEGEAAAALGLVFLGPGQPVAHHSENPAGEGETRSELAENEVPPQRRRRRPGAGAGHQGAHSRARQATGELGRGRQEQGQAQGGGALQPPPPLLPSPPPPPPPFLQQHLPVLFAQALVRFRRRGRKWQEAPRRLIPDDLVVLAQEDAPPGPVGGIPPRRQSEQGFPQSLPPAPPLVLLRHPAGAGPPRPPPGGLLAPQRRQDGHQRARRRPV
ncbi:cyclin-T-like isoform X2 [Hippocampus zosterae]|uniref:cyclin-T-like isoform X2 n=1 Tax=Hippocampus zosterae TaxID=109293 RepID=UPI00223D644D|nr:cyclin-T-like isoform X2 [Hippocampus zosterae]